MSEALIAEANELADKVETYSLERHKALLAEKRRLEDLVPRLDRAIERVDHAIRTLGAMFPELVDGPPAPDAQSSPGCREVAK